MHIHKHMSTDKVVAQSLVRRMLCVCPPSRPILARTLFISRFCLWRSRPYRIPSVLVWHADEEKSAKLQHRLQGLFRSIEAPIRRYLTRALDDAAAPPRHMKAPETPKEEQVSAHTIIHFLLVFLLQITLVSRVVLFHVFISIIFYILEHLVQRKN